MHLYVTTLVALVGLLFVGFSPTLLAVYFPGTSLDKLDWGIIKLLFPTEEQRRGRNPRLNS